MPLKSSVMPPAADLVALGVAEQAVGRGDESTAAEETGRAAAEADGAGVAVPARIDDDKVAAAEEVDAGTDGVARMIAAQRADQRAVAIVEEVDRARARAAEAVAGRRDERVIGREIEEADEGTAEGVARAGIRVGELEAAPRPDCPRSSHPRWTNYRPLSRRSGCRSPLQTGQQRSASPCR